MSTKADLLLEESVFSDYKIIKKIGKNSWSSLFLVEHRFIKKKYVLYVLHSYLFKDEEFMSLFEDSVSKAVFFDHPNILKIKNVSESQGLYFIVTDFLESKIEVLSLTQYLFCQKNLLSEEDVFSILSQVASVLDYAHKKGCYSFSLFPDSIFIDSSESKIKVITTYFGIHHLFIKSTLLSYLEEHKDLDVFFRFIAFLSPEQKINSISREYSDIYSFGILTYFLLFKKVPEGIFPMPSEVFPHYVYDWDFLLNACLSCNLSNDNREISSLFRKKEENCKNLERIQSLLQESEIKSKNLRSLSSDLELNLEKNSSNERQQVLSLEVVQERLEVHDKISSKEVFEGKEDLNTTKGFVLVSPCSIDKSIIDVSFNKLKNTNSVNHDQEEHLTYQTSNDEYSQALHAMLNKDPIVSHYSLKKSVELKPEPLLTKMVLIQGGRFSRGSMTGSRDEAPKHIVNLSSFFLDIHPVTNEQYLRFLDFIGGEQDQNCNDLIRLKESRIQRRAGSLFIETGYHKHPVVGVTWYGAVSYASWVGKRLPTEAEWEIAAKGGLEDNEFPTGNEINKEQSNFFSSDTTPVMAYSCNEYGLYDMAGNVYEWCQDWYGYNYYEISSQEPNEPKGPIQGVYRVLRGGCWKSLKADLRCSHRHRNNPGTVNSTYGFRCALDIR